MIPERIIFAGSGAFGLPTLEALGANVVQVVSQPDHPAGRGRKLTPTAIAAFAISKNIPLVRTVDINQEKLVDADVMVVIAFGQKISAEQVNRPWLRSVNLHASLLPKYRGAAPIAWPMINGDAVTGNSVIRLAARMDAGAVLGQSRVEIEATETAGELHDRLSRDGVFLMSRVLEELNAGRAIETAQDESAATIARKLSRRDAVIDFGANADVVARRIRGLWPWPGCRVKLVDATGGEIARLALARARAVESEGSRWQNGEIETTGAVCAGGGAGAVEILELQPEGGRLMGLADYRRGRPWAAGMRVVSIEG